MNARDLFSGLGDKSILVIGDVMFDEFVSGTASRISPEAPVPVLDVSERSVSPGGAANTACNVKASGVNVYLFGVVGEDSNAKALVKVLEDAGINLEGLFLDANRPTTVKTRIVSGTQQIVRIDQESREEISRDLSKRIIEKIEGLMPKIDAVIISDYSKGMMTPFLLEKLIPLARDCGKPVVVDPKVKDYGSYRGVSVLTPSKEEVCRAMGISLINETSLRNAALKTLNQLECDAVLVNKEKEGLCLFEKSGEITRLPASSCEFYNPMGVRDTIVTVLTLALTSGADMKGAARLASSAAEIASAKIGASPMNFGDVKERLLSRQMR